MAHKIRYPMPVSQRAKIFAPFDALKGFTEALRAKERIIVPRRLLSEDKLSELDRKARELTPGSHISVICYRDGGYHTLSGHLKQIDRESRILRLDEEEISLDDICELDAKQQTKAVFDEPERKCENKSI